MLTKSDARILIIDDEEDITSMLQKALEKHDFKVTTYNDPVEALSNFRPSFYDLVLLDIKMPKMDGLELYQKLLSIDSKTKICFMTAFEFYYDALKELFPDTYTSICFIKKPFGIQDFVKRISKEMANE